MQGKTHDRAGALSAMTRRLAPLAEVLIYPMSALILVRSVWVGLGMWLVLLQEPRLALVAFAALSIGEPAGRLFARLLRQPFDTMTRVNMLLGALVGAWLAIPTGLSPAVILLSIATMQTMTLVASFLLRQLMHTAGLPALILPYCLVATMIFTIAPLAVYGASAYFEWPHHTFSDISGLPKIFIQSMGVFLFSPSVLSGAVIVLLLAAYSPLMLLTGIAGWLGGALAATALVNLGIFFYWELTSFNYFLAGMAVGSVFLVPSLGSALSAVLAGVTAAFIAAFIQNFFLVPGLSILPFTFVMSLFSTLIITRGSKLRRSDDWLTSPEERLLKNSWLMARWNEPGTPLLAVPVPGPMAITQGFGGAITHRDNWQHALDFERPANAATEGIWGSMVYSPVVGTVVDTQDSIADNSSGLANYGENWGNYVLLRADAGHYVQLSHLMRGSNLVVPGQRVGFSTLLARVGNSGRSITPHLHMQAQAEPIAGAPTIPFMLANYLEYDPADGGAKHWHAAGVPTQGKVVGSALPIQAVHDTLTSIAPGRSIWTVNVEGEPPHWFRPRQPLVLTTELASDGHYVIRDADNDRLEARLEGDGWRVHLVSARPGSLIATLAAGMSVVPYCAFSGLRWNDASPRVLPPLLRGLQQKFAPTHPGRLQHLEMVCERAPSETAPTLLISASASPVQSHAPERCHVEIAARRGPVVASWQKRGARVTYSAMSFTAS